MAGLLRRLRSEATAEPFTIHLDDGSRIVVEQPAVEQLLDVTPGTPVRVLLEGLCGHDLAAELLDAVAGEDYAVLRALIEDIRAHFSVDDATRLAWLLDRYGDHIEADLRPLGVDVLDLWRGRITIRALLNQIDHLPRTSHYQDALAQDDEVHEGRVAPPAGQPKPPPLTEFSPEVEVLAALVDRIGDLTNAVIASGGGKPRPVKPWPRPVTAADRVRARRAREGAEDLMRKLFPDLDQPTPPV